MPKHNRKELIKNWQDLKISFYEAYEHANNVFMPNEFKEILQGEEAQTQIGSILHEVFTAASTEMRDKLYSSPVSSPE